MNPRALVEPFERSLSASLSEWWRKAAADSALHHFVAHWSACGRKLGLARCQLAGAEHFEKDELGRALLLVRFLEKLELDRHPALLHELFHTGEVRERQAVAKALDWLPKPERFVPIAVEAVRGNMLSVLESLSCENFYPATYLPDEPFNQMVVKALFNGLRLARIRGLRDRLTPELRRMVEAFVSERRAAGREVPFDVSLVLGDWC